MFRSKLQNLSPVQIQLMSRIAHAAWPTPETHFDLFTFAKMGILKINREKIVQITLKGTIHK